MQRIVIIGNAGSGKTTLARDLARCLGCPHIEMDALFWETNWIAADATVFRERVGYCISAPAWVADGNYVSRVRDLVWTRADTLVWLDYSLAVILSRLATRSVRRIIRREVLWNGNRENWRGQFLARDSLFLWALQSYRRDRPRYERLLALPEYAHLTVIRHSSARETAEWLRKIDRRA